MTLLFESACLLFFAFDLLLIFYVIREYNILKGVVGMGPSGESFAGRNRIISGLILLFSLTALIVWVRPLVLPNVWLPGAMDAAIASAYENHGDFAAASSVLIDSVDHQFLSGKIFRDAVYAFFLIFWVSAELFILIVILKMGMLLRDKLFRHIGSQDE